VDRAEVDTGCFSQRFFSAVNSAAWCTDRDVRRGVYWALIWADRADEYARQAATLARYCDELEALSAAH
jgi:hypothetical protein